MFHLSLIQVSFLVPSLNATRCCCCGAIFWVCLSVWCMGSPSAMQSKIRGWQTSATFHLEDDVLSPVCWVNFWSSEPESHCGDFVLYAHIACLYPLSGVSLQGSCLYYLFSSLLLQQKQFKEQRVYFDSHFEGMVRNVRWLLTSCPGLTLGLPFPFFSGMVPSTFTVVLLNLS